MPDGTPMKPSTVLRRSRVERLRHQALLAERQYNPVDPHNRLIAAELERLRDGFT